MQTSKENMVLLGIDPGTATTGFGIIDARNPKKLVPIHYGQIRTSKDDLMQDRLLKIYNSVNHLIEEYSPDALVIEQLFFNTNVKTAITVGQARGIYILSAGYYKLPVFAQYENFNPVQQTVDGLNEDKYKTEKTTIGLNFFPTAQTVLKADYAMRDEGTKETEMIFSLGLGFIF